MWEENKTEQFDFLNSLAFSLKNAIPSGSKPFNTSSKR